MRSDVTCSSSIRTTPSRGTVLTDLDLPFGADILCYTPEEFARKREELGIVSAAIEEGFRLV
jgi:hypothetical protein